MGPSGRVAGSIDGHGRRMTDFLRWLRQYMYQFGSQSHRDTIKRIG